MPPIASCGLHRVCRRRMHACPASSPLRTAGGQPLPSRPGRPARPWRRPHFALAPKGVRKGSRAPRSRAAQVASANCFESPSPVGFGPSPSPYQPAGPPRSPPRAGYHSGAIGPTLADNLMQKFRYLKMITSPCELVWTSAQVQDTLVLITRRRCRRTEQRQRFPDFVLVIPRVGERKRRAPSTDAVDGDVISLPERFSNDLSSKIGHLYFDCFEELELGELSLAPTGSTQSKNPGED